jgi:hypothetical protein
MLREHPPGPLPCWIREVFRPSRFLDLFGQLILARQIFDKAPEDAEYQGRIMYCEPNDNFVDPQLDRKEYGSLP